MCLVTGERNWGSGVFLKCIFVSGSCQRRFHNLLRNFELKNIPVSCNLTKQAGLKGHSLSFLLPFLFSKHSSAWPSSPTQHWLQHNNCNMLLFCLCWWDLSVVVVFFFPSETCHFSKKSTWTGNFFLRLFPCTLLGLTALVRELLFLPSPSLFQRLLRMRAVSEVTCRSSSICGWSHVMRGLQFSAVSPKAAFCFRLSLQLQSWLFKKFFWQLWGGKEWS